MIYIKHSPGVAPSLCNYDFFLYVELDACWQVIPTSLWFLFILRLLKGAKLFFFFECLKMTGEKSHIHNNINKCYLLCRIILQKQPQLYEAIFTSLGTGAIWMKMAISGLLRDQTMLYYPLGKFPFHVCMPVNQAFRGASITHPEEFLSCFLATELDHLK